MSLFCGIFKSNLNYSNQNKLFQSEKKVRGTAVLELSMWILENQGKQKKSLCEQRNFINLEHHQLGKCKHFLGLCTLNMNG